MNKRIKLITIIGLIIIFIIFGYGVGYRIGTFLGKDLVQTLDRLEKDA